MSASGWDHMAEWWDEHLGDTGDLWHRTLIDPPLLELCGEVDGLHVLDLACGNGYLSRRFARQGATVIGVDANAPILERARQREAREPLGVAYVASFSHPCFDKVDTSGWSIEHIYPVTTIWRKMSRYREIAVAEVPWLSVPNQTVYTRAYHRPLSWYFRALRAAGLVVAALEEPEPTAEFLAGSPQGPWIAEIPLHCVIEAWKLG